MQTDASEPFTVFRGKLREILTVLKNNVASCYDGIFRNSTVASRISKMAVANEQSSETVDIVSYYDELYFQIIVLLLLSIRKYMYVSV